MGAAPAARVAPQSAGSGVDGRHRGAPHCVPPAAGAAGAA